MDQLLSGKRAVYGLEVRSQILFQLEQPHPQGLARWDRKYWLRVWGFGRHRLWRVLRKEGPHLLRRSSWCVSTDPDFTRKAFDYRSIFGASDSCHDLVGRREAHDSGD